MTSTPKKNSARSYAQRPLADQLSIAKRALEHVTNNPAISGPMAEFGYNPKKLEQFNTLYNEVVEADSVQIQEYGERAEAYAAFEKIYAIAKEEFSTLRKLLRVALRECPEKLVRLSVNGTAKSSINATFEQMRNCYLNLFKDPEILHRLSVIGKSAEQLKEYEKNVYRASDAYTTFYKMDSEAVNSTRIRDEKIEELVKFMSDFNSLAKVAFASQPELLSQIS